MKKAYFEFKKDIRLRYKYLVIRSGLRSAIIDIPLSAIANVDSNGHLIDKSMKIYDKVAKMSNIIVHRTSFFEFEWNIAAGMCGKYSHFGAGKSELDLLQGHIKAVFLSQLNLEI